MYFVFNPFAFIILRKSPQDAEPPWGTVNTKDREEIKQKDKEIKKKIKSYYNSQKTFDSTISHQYHKRSEPPKSDSPLKKGLLEKLQGTIEVPKRNGLKTIYGDSYVCSFTECQRILCTSALPSFNFKYTIVADVLCVGVETVGCSK